MAAKKRCRSPDQEVEVNCASIGLVREEGPGEVRRFLYSFARDKLWHEVERLKQAEAALP